MYETASKWQRVRDIDARSLAPAPKVSHRVRKRGNTASNEAIKHVMACTAAHAVRGKEEQARWQRGLGNAYQIDMRSSTTLVVRVLVQAATRVLADLELGLPSGTTARARVED